MGRVRVWARRFRAVWTDPANDGERLRRCVLAVRFQVADRLLGRPTRVPYASASVVEARRDGFSSERAVYSRLPDHAEMKVWQRVLGPGSTFVDVGANVGLYTLLAAECGADVVAIEPQHAATAQLERNLTLNGVRAHVERVAVADRIDVMAIAGRDGNRKALVVDQAASDGGPDEVVTVTTLDALLGSRVIAGMKIDVEGAERLVLEGARGLLTRGAVALIQLEWNDRSLATLGETREPVAKLLHGFGYTLSRPDASGTLSPIDDLGFGDDVFAVLDPDRMIGVTWGEGHRAHRRFDGATAAKGTGGTTL